MLELLKFGDIVQIINQDFYSNSGTWIVVGIAADETTYTLLSTSIPSTRVILPTQDVVFVSRGGSRD